MLEILGQLRGQPSSVLLVKALGRVRRVARRQLVRVRDHLRGSHGLSWEELSPEPLAINVQDIPNDLACYLAAVAPLYLNHRFDLLGSGWVKVSHGIECIGLDGRRFPPGAAVQADPEGYWLEGRINGPNLLEAKRLWAMVGGADYVPIDWQLDFKSGYRWSELSCFSSIRVGPAPGADIKVPWELARMQHLPQLALCAILASAGDERFCLAQVYVDEIRAELLDFIATNPPRFGVNWACTMDVAIRVANWLLTIDLLAGSGIALDQPVHRMLARSVADHAVFIAANLEWSESNRTNHYLADIVGLLYAAARLDKSPRCDAWLAFAVRELTGEVEVQFHPDGSCYEGATSYHRLSSELILFGLAITAGLPSSKRAVFSEFDPRAITVRPPFLGPPVQMFGGTVEGITPVAPAVCERLWRAARFSAWVTRPDGRICQIGDTDSGRLFWLHPQSSGGALPTRDDLNHDALVEAIDSLFSGAPLAPPRWLDTLVVRAFAGDWHPRPPLLTSNFQGYGNPEDVERDIVGLVAGQTRIRRYAFAASAEPWRREAFPDFGLYLFRRHDDFIAFRCAGLPPVGTPSGHTHDDALGIEIMLGGRLLVADPGTYVYTPDPVARNAYRNANAHDAPRAADWPLTLSSRYLFELSHRAGAECICWRSDAVAGRVVAPEGTLFRLLRISSDGLEILDGVSNGALAPLCEPLPVCEGYGKKA